MNVILFFTYDISLKTWQEIGLLEREMKYFNKLIKYGIKLTLVTYGDSSDLGIINNSNISVIPIYSLYRKPRRRLAKYFKSFIIPYLIRNELKNCDLIKTNQLLGSWVAIISKIFFRKKLIIRTGYDLLTFNLKNKKSFLIIMFTYLLTIFSIIFSNKYFVSSKTDKNFLNKITLKFFYKKIIIVRNWIEFEENVNLQKRSNTLLTVGRLENQKNLFFLVNLAKKYNYSLDIIGSGSLKKELVKASYGNTNINFLGNFSNTKLLEIYKNYKIFILASFFEGNPKSMLEAMSAGCIVVASNIPNINEIITNGKNGYLHDFDQDEIKNVLETIFAGKQNSEIIENSRNTVRDDFNLNTLAYKEVEIIKKLTKN